MKELERRALLGDRQAQKECAEKGIVLPCPLCGKQVKRSVSGRLFYCPECCFHTAFHSNAVNKEAALFIWNTRLAPPFGRCKDCAAFEGNKCKNTGYYTPETGYCHDFSPKENEILPSVEVKP